MSVSLTLVKIRFGWSTSWIGLCLTCVYQVCKLSHRILKSPSLLLGDITEQQDRKATAKLSFLPTSDLNKIVQHFRVLVAPFSFSLKKVVMCGHSYINCFTYSFVSNLFL